MTSTSGFSRRNSGFTLLELLILLAIVGILAGVALPLFVNKREQPRRSSCQSNLKTIGLGLLQYCRDYDERFPRPAYERPHLVWQQVLEPYMQARFYLFVCPSNPAANESPVNRSIAFFCHSAPRSYAINHRVSQGSTSVAAIKSPTRKIMVAESRAPWPDFGSAWWNGRGWESGFAGHLGMANYLFADGHVKAMRPVDTATPFNMWGGMDGGACPSRSINCDTPEPAIIKGLQELQDKS